MSTATPPAVVPGPLPPPYTPLAETLALLEPRLPPALVGDAAWRAVGPVGGALPAALASAVYLECRLARDALQVDVILKVERQGGAILAGRNPVIRLPEPLAVDPLWGRVADLCARWLDGRTGTARAIDHLWLELDLRPGEAGAVPAPSVFIGLEAGAARTPGGGWTCLLDEIAEDLAPDGLDRETTRTLRRVIAARPPDSRTPYLGFMLARPGGAVRVYFAGMPESELATLLKGAGWPGSTQRLAAALSRAGSGRPRVSMAHLDAAGGLPPRVGVEYPLLRRPQLRGMLAEGPFLDGLVGAGLCDAGKRDALRHWPGFTRVTLPHEIWPSLLVRRVNCVKLLYDDAGGVEAKAYLLAQPHPHTGTRSSADGAEWSRVSIG